MTLYMHFERARNTLMEIHVLNLLNNSAAIMLSF